MPNSIRPDPSTSPSPAGPDVVRVVSDRLLARSETWHASPIVSPTHPAERPVPGIESPSPAHLGSLGDRDSSESDAIDRPAGPVVSPTDIAPATTGPSLFLLPSSATDAVATDGIAPVPPAEVSQPPVQPGPSVARPAVPRLFADAPSTQGEWPTVNSTGFEPVDRPAGNLDPGGPASVPPTAIPYQMLQEPGLSPSSSPTEAVSTAENLLPLNEDLPSVRPHRADTWGGRFADLGPAGPASAVPASGNAELGMVPTDEAVFAAAAGAVPAGGASGGMGMSGADLARTNELLQQLIDVVRKQAGGLGPLVPSGGRPVYAERS